MFRTPIVMGRRMTSYLDPPPPPPKTEPDSLLRRYLSKKIFTGKYGHYRFFVLTWSAWMVANIGILLDAFVIRPEKYPPKMEREYRTDYNEELSLTDAWENLKGRFERDPWWLGMWGDVEAARQENFKKAENLAGEKGLK